ncbi:DNA repair protein RAD51 homolog 4 isoform X3 [Nerophis ophidion]|uniref:DNA repair protein RAD51 homolog 4 isoform X3 n=1 Tax=Nerophis ophidion TaxID=159077 RepID=UPI002ADF533F|nr:DNA repair protein RAD51 homolog 4 isoform X3 [Nerophis ophidion]
MVLLREGMCPGLDEVLLRRLREAHIKTVEDLVSSSTEELAQKCSVSYTALLTIRRVLLAQHAAFPVSGADLYDELLSSTAILSTGNPKTSTSSSSSIASWYLPTLFTIATRASHQASIADWGPCLTFSLDVLLDSGVYTGEITELAGGPGSGKSQVCFGVAVHISHHLRQKVVYVDTTGGLSASRLQEMLQSETSSAEEQMEALQRIHVHRVFDVYSLLRCLHRLRSGELQQACGGGVGGGSVKALIVDSVSAVIAPLLGGKHHEGEKMTTNITTAAHLDKPVHDESGVGSSEDDR